MKVDFSCEIDKNSEKAENNTEVKSHYESLKKMVDSKILDIRLIISPSRTGSTLIESSFLKNSLIDAHIHEPFITLRKGDAQEAYETILRTITEVKDLSLKKKQIMVKEMSHWIFINDEYRRFLTLVKSPIIILIRNPLLNTESRIKKILETLDLREKQVVKETLLDFYAQTKGEESWKIFLNKKNNIPENLIKDEAIKIYQKLERLNGLSEVEMFPFQRWLLDYYAIIKGYKRWKIMFNEGCDNHDYKIFKEILRDERIYDIDGTGWNATNEIVKYLENIGKEILIVDSSDYRLNPETVVPFLCNKWDIPFSENMINWGDKGLGLYTGQIKPHQSIWYDRLQLSTRIEPPTEVVVPIQNFPDFIVKHLIEIDFPIYISMIKRLSKIKPKRQLIHRKIQVPVKRKIYRRLKDIGLLPEKMDLKNKKEYDMEIFEILFKQNILNCTSEKINKLSLKKAYLRGEATVGLTLQEIDPVYAYLFDNGLYGDDQFMKKNKNYNLTLNTIKKILENRTK